MVTDATTGFAMVNGTRLYYEIAGNGPPLVFLHGGYIDNRMWDAQFVYFARHFRAVRFDFRGFGRSERGEPPYTHAADTRILLTSLGIVQAHLVGLSLGGMVALDFALAYPDIVNRLVLVASSVRGYTFTANMQGRAADALRHQSILNTARVTRDLANAVEEFLALWADGPERQAPKPVREAVRQMVRQHYERHGFGPFIPETHTPPLAVDRLAEIIAPTLVVVGSSDQPTILDTATQFAAQLPALHATITFPHVAHMVNMERPGEFNRHVEAFLRDTDESNP